MCNDAFPSEDQLTAHQVVKHGKPITEADERQEQMGRKPKKRGTRRETKDTKEKRLQEHQQPSAVTNT